MIKLIIISEAFRDSVIFKRWRMLTEFYNDVDVTLIGPDYYEDKTWWPIVKIVKAKEIREERFRFIPISMKANKIFKNGWLSYDLFKILKKLKPDFIYLIGFEVNNIIYQIALTKTLFLPTSKIATFTMRGLDYPKNKHFKLRWFFSKKIFDAIFCHYPQGMKVIRERGKYKGPVYMQTQVGVDSEIFKPDITEREKIRKTLNIKDDEFVFGTASRMESSKGIFDVIDALPTEGKWKLLMLGDGKEMNQLKNNIKEKGLESRVILQGYVQPWTVVNSYMNAMDAFIHFPKTTKKWIDTFPLAVVQAMAIGLPVIGSNSGAVPYQLGEKGKIVEEGNTKKLNKELVNMMNNPKKAKKYGEELKNRVMNTFEIKHLTKCFNVTMREIIKGIYDKNHIDQANFYF